MKDLNLHGKVVLLRADFNVPMEEVGAAAVASYDRRLRVTIPTIEYLLERDCRVLLCSHLGRPRGEVVEGLRMAPLAQHLATLIGRPVKALSECMGPSVGDAVAAMRSGDVVMLENLRFHAGEEKNDPAFAKALARLAEIFVLDAFGAAHRPHASIVGVMKYLPSAAGLLLQREVKVIGAALESPDRPLAAILGGAKVSDKLFILSNLLDKANVLIIGGGMVGTFLKAQGYSVGASLVEDDLLETTRGIMETASSKGVALHLPVDLVVASEFKADPKDVTTVELDEVPEGHYIMDIGQRSRKEFVAHLESCKTVIWNGPMGVFEYEVFAQGTRSMAQALASLDAVTIIGGGSTAEAVESLGLGDNITHVSSGGGAMLEFLEGKVLPGIAALPSAALQSQGAIE